MSTNSYELVIFDLDGTLIEFHYDFLFHETDRVLVELGLGPVDRSVLAASFAAFDYFRFLPEDAREWFAAEFWARFDWERFPKPQPLPGARDLLTRLAGLDIKTAIVTSRHTPPEILREELNHTGLMDSVLHLICRTDESVHWSDKRSNLLAMCDYADCPPKRSVMVGDIPADIESARDAGLGLSVAVLSGGIDRQVLEASRPDFILPDVSKLLELFV